MTRAALLLALLLASTSLMAGSDVTSYESCLARVQENPEEAYEDALNWHDLGGGGAAAKHCAALALVAGGRYDEAARRLEALAAEPGAGDRAARVEILGQAGNAWLLQGNATAAYDAFSRALTLSPTDSHTLIDRARALMLLDRRSEAEEDLAAAIHSNPIATEAFVLRSSCRRERGDLKGAGEDANAAVQLAPRNAEALLERGLVRQALDDRAGAFADWRSALAADASSAAGQEAQRLLQEAALDETLLPAGGKPASKATP